MADDMLDARGPWLAADPAAAARWLAPVRARWWIAGGWALDLFVGEAGRPHADLDVGVLRRDVLDVLRTLPLWEFYAARGGVLTHVGRGSAPAADVHSLWCRPRGATAWALELMLDEADGESWVFRRHESIRRPLSTAIIRTAAGVDYLAPEIQLLYKAKSVRPRDRRDFERVVPRLSPTARGWLRESLAATLPGHPWLEPLDAVRITEGA